MAQFASNTELADRLGIELTSAEATRADSLLKVASGLIQAAARQTIELVEDDVLTIRGTRESAILLPERPVVSVASVKLDGSTLASNSYYVDGDQLVRKNANLSRILDAPVGKAWGDPSEPLVITYTHGYSAIPEAIKAVCLDATARVWVNPGAASQESYGSESVSYPVGGLTLTKREHRVVREVVRRGSEAADVR